MYNPNITGYSDSTGPFIVSLEQAKMLYGGLPSSYSLLPPVKHPDKDSDERDPNKVLNLDLGFTLKRWLAQGGHHDLKPFIAKFFSTWHRDYQKEFGISVKPLRNLNLSKDVSGVMNANSSTLESVSNFEIKKAVLDNDVFRIDTFNSIRPDKVIQKSIDAIGKKVASGSKSQHLKTLLARLRARQVLDRMPFLDSNRYPLELYADEIAKALGEISRYMHLPGSDSLRFTSGQGVEFAYAPRDFSYLQLGRLFGDCTSDKKHLQSNCQTENIYWTVFSWIMDANYQILLAMLDGKPVIKCHILPLFVDVLQTGREIYPCLFVDAIETTAQFRKDGNSRDEQANGQLEHIFGCLIDEVTSIADRMGISSVYSERFSNTARVRQELEKLPEIYLDTKRIVKVDELEDVYSCATSFCREHGYAPPDAVFMEIQARNTYLISETIIGSNKSFGIVRGDPSDGLLAKHAFGV